MSNNQSIKFFITTVGLSFCAMAQADQPQNQYFTANNNRSTHIAFADQTKMSDADLTKKIEDKISSGWFSDGYDQVHVQVMNGKVMLKGMVKTQSDKEKLEKEIRNIDGVMALDSSQLVVQNMSSSDKKSERNEFPQDKYATAEDEQLNQRIRDVVSRGWLMDSYKDISLNTTKGIVTLDGTVKSADDRQDLINKIQKIDGVKSVKSNLTVKG